MKETGNPRSFLIVSDARHDSLCASAMYFGVSCAFFVLKYLSQQALYDQKCAETRDKMLQGSAHLLGLLVWRAQKEEVKTVEKQCELLQKLETAETEIKELKRRRSEDAKANERVASIYASQEQSWFAERKRLQHQIGSLLNDLRILDGQKNGIISEMSEKLCEMEFSVKSKDSMLREEEKKREEVEEKLKSTEVVLEEVRESTKCEAQDHSAELLKHKTAFIELVSNQRHLEAELSRTLRQVEAVKQQFEFVFEEKEEAVLMVQQLSFKIEKMNMDFERKDKMLSAMMRKSKLDSAEKQMQLKEAKLSKPKRTKADTTERWRGTSGSRNGRRTLSSMLARRLSSRFEFLPSERRGKAYSFHLGHKNYVFDDLVVEVLKENQECSHLEPSLPLESIEFEKAVRLDEWVHSEAEKYHNAVEQGHQLELDAFAVQMQLKEDKLETYRWKLRSIEQESKRLRSKIEILNQDMSQLRSKNLKAEALLLDRENELKTLKDEIAFQSNKLSTQKTKLHSSRSEALVVHDMVLTKVNILSMKLTDREQTLKKNSLDVESKKREETESIFQESSSTAIEETEEKGAQVDHVSCLETLSPEDFATNRKEILCLNTRDKSAWKEDIHALGVSYKIKRLSQQLVLMDRLAGRHESAGTNGSDENGVIRMKGFLVFLSLLHKQVSRYQSLQQKTDDLNRRMGEKDVCIKQAQLGTTRKKETKALEHFLEETFDLQRFIVATGQKLMEINSKLTSAFIGELNGSTSFDIDRFVETVQSLFKDVQRGLEVRIARIIGDLEGTLACHGIHWRSMLS